MDVFTRWPTGAKLFLILSIALLPLALIAIFATLRVTQIADTELRSHLCVAASESSRAIAIELVGDMTALRVAVDALTADRGDAPSCARAQGVFAQQSAAGTSFVILDRRGRAICGEPFPGAAAFARQSPADAVSARLVAERGLMLRFAGRSDGLTAAAYFPAPFLAQISRPSGFAPDYGLAMALGDERLELDPLARESALERRETIRSDLGIAGLALEMQVRSAPIGSPLLVALTLPLLMWAAAAAISWFVVDRLLIAPLRALRGSIAAYAPGDQPDPAMLRALPAQEIRDLGDTFRALSRTVAIHEAGLAEGLMRQTKLTREVHHRVKNNLQVISSLINFHARGARSVEATQAYSSIQRRVDALAVVHRYHYAEMEENRGVGLRAVLGELASSIRATAPEGTRVGIVLDIDPYYVTQDVAVAVAFLVTELVELAMTCASETQVSMTLKPLDDPQRALLRLTSRALVDTDHLRDGLKHRYGRVIEGLTRQLRSTLQHDPLSGAYEIAIAVTGRE
ncbi:histidine kinase dimerization/phosphoacceptor domain -containing protein [Sphingomonas sp. BE138]|uniref:sensor histidine kinase n=1 Tax=Sphingomonas sp. BE138 TaxID=2817845 RepID=UPI00286A8C26|nr:histidine kinase dimerization/phosphoacceptor domain -containing protein [Sphingomonas sp. BE138]